VIRHYGGILQFVDHTPGLSWFGPRSQHRICLDPLLHRQLRSGDVPAAAAAAAAATGAVVEGGNGAGAGAVWWGDSGPGCTLGVEQRWQQAFAGQQHPPVPRHAQADAWVWMLKLAAFLEPGDPFPAVPRTVSFAFVKKEIPFPGSLMQLFGCDPRHVLQALPGVSWSSDTNLVSLNPRLHRQLRQAAAAAAAAAAAWPGSIPTPAPAPQQQQAEWQAGGDSASIPPAPRAVQGALKIWLYELAELVQPGPLPKGRIKFSRVEELLPVPEIVLQHYGSLKAVVEVTIPTLYQGWDCTAGQSCWTSSSTSASGPRLLLLLRLQLPLLLLLLLLLLSCLSLLAGWYLDQH
jgi:hypothetical protein